MNRFSCHGAFFTLILALAFSASSVLAQRPMTVDDGINLVRPNDIMISPDGSRVFFSKVQPNWKLTGSELKKGYKAKKSYFMVPATGGDEVQFLGEDGGSEFRFSPDGRFLSLKRKGEKEQQIFLMRLDGGEPIQLTEHKDGIKTYQWFPDSKKILFVSNKPKSEEAKKLHEAGYDAIPVDEGPHGQREGQWEDFWIFDLDTEKEQQVSDEKFNIDDFDVAPDGKSVLFTARFESRRNQENLSEIYQLSFDDGKKVQLTQNQAPESNPEWAPDGESFAYTAPDDETWELRHSKIWIMNVKSRQYNLVSGNFKGDIGEFTWEDSGDTLLFVGSEGIQENLFRLDTSSREVTKLSSYEGTLSNVSFSRDGSILAYSFTDFETPSNVFAATLAPSLRPIRLSDLNPDFADEIETAGMKVVQWESSDGKLIEGLLYLPLNYSEEEPVPLILSIHGGPAGAFTNRFVPQFHVYAGLGYASLCPNVRGSRGYDDELLRGNIKDIGGGDYQDLMTGVDYLIREGYVDPDKMALRGWSYGGILGGWTITQTDRFKAASVGAMVSDWTSEYGPGFNYDVRLWYIGGTPWTNPEGYREKSALTHIASVDTPTIIFHGVKDTTDTEAQSMMFFTALKDMEKEVRYLKFPREPHGFREPRHQRMRDIEEIKWMERYVKGNEWEPWELSEPDQKAVGKEKEEE